MLKETARFYRFMALGLIVFGVSTIALIHFVIKTTSPKGLPSGYLIVSVEEIYPILGSYALGWREDAVLQSGSFEVYGDYGKYREPQARLYYSSNLSFVDLTFEITEVNKELEVEIINYPGDSGTYSRKINVSNFSPVNVTPGEHVDLDSRAVLQSLLDAGGRQFILDHNYILWPAELNFEVTTDAQGSAVLVWQLCFQEGFYRLSWQCFTLPE